MAKDAKIQKLVAFKEVDTAKGKRYLLNGEVWANTPPPDGCSKFETITSVLDETEYPNTFNGWVRDSVESKISLMLQYDASYSMAISNLLK